MITFQYSSYRVAFYLKEKEDTPVYYDEKEDRDKVIGLDNRKNITDYENKLLYNSGRYPLKENVVQEVRHMLIYGYNPRSHAIHPFIKQLYEKQMEHFCSIFPYEFRRENEENLIYPCPSLEEEQRDSIIVAGNSGAGKSRWCALFCETYNFTYPERKIYLFSEKVEDKALDKLSYVKRVPKKEWEDFCGDFNDEEEEKLVKKRMAKRKRELPKKKVKVENGHFTVDDSDSFSDGSQCAEVDDKTAKQKYDFNISEFEDKRGRKISEDDEDVGDDDEQQKKRAEKDEKTIQNFKNSLFIFDDIEDTTPQSTRKFIFSFKDFINRLGRSSNIDIIICRHILMDYGRTRNDLNEATMVTLFPNHTDRFHLIYYCKEKLLLNDESIDKVVNCSDRWVTIHKRNKVCLSPSKVWVMKDVYKNNKKTKK